MFECNNRDAEAQFVEANALMPQRLANKDFA